MKGIIILFRGFYLLDWTSYRSDVHEEWFSSSYTYGGSDDNLEQYKVLNSDVATIMPLELYEKDSDYIRQLIQVVSRNLRAAFPFAAIILIDEQRRDFVSQTMLANTSSAHSLPLVNTTISFTFGYIEHHYFQECSMDYVQFL